MFYGKNKALTFSYDDGVRQDARLAEIFNRYGMKCTFNLNSGLLDPKNRWDYKGADCIHMTAEEIKKSLAGHEIAVHGVEHLDITKLTSSEKTAELLDDKANLERIFGCNVKGMAYAFGTFDEETKKIAKSGGLNFARTVRPTFNFDLQTDLLEFDPTCHHNEKALFELGEKFLALPDDKPALFYVWGHSYEFDGDNNWDVIEDFCRMMQGRDDIFYGTNSQVLLG